jgi:hypothetical protein
MLMLRAIDMFLSVFFAGFDLPDMIEDTAAGVTPISFANQRWVFPCW